MELVSEEVWRALGYLFISGIVAFAWKQAHDAARRSGLYMTLVKGLIWCAGIAMFAAVIMGNPSCEIEGDPLYGGCEQYADDGFEPTGEQRAARFAYFLTLLYVPVVIGSLNGSKKSEQFKTNKDARG